MDNFILFVTPKAKSYFSKHMKENQTLHVKLKVSGCSGYSTIFNIIDKDENAQTFNGLSILVSKEDQIKLHETVIDIRVEGLNQKVVFDNPKAIHHCGCGESFALKDEEKELI